MARKGTTVATDLFSATRLTNSTNGNPRFDLHTSDGTFRTQSDASCSYDIANILRTIPRGETIPVTLSLTPAGRVWNIEPRTEPLPATVGSRVRIVSPGSQYGRRGVITSVLTGEDRPFRVLFDGEERADWTFDADDLAVLASA
jgi:hypothetical protein